MKPEFNFEGVKIVGKNGYLTQFLAILRATLFKIVLLVLKGYYGFAFFSVSTLRSYIYLLKIYIGWMKNYHSKWATEIEWKVLCPTLKLCEKIMNLLRLPITNLVSF